jgi:hypothetical protein
MVQVKIIKGDKALALFLQKLDKLHSQLVDIKFTTDAGIHHFLVIYRD